MKQPLTFVLWAYMCLGVAGGIVEQEAPIQVSNVAIFNTATSKADRVGFKVDGDSKVRIFKSTGEVIDS